VPLYACRIVDPKKGNEETAYILAEDLGAGLALAGAFVRAKHPEADIDNVILTRVADDIVSAAPSVPTAAELVAVAKDGE
jgi:hypothetical protein